MLYGNDMFLSTILLKLSGDVNGHYWTLSCLFCNKVAVFVQISAPMETPVSILPPFECSICESAHQSMVDNTGHFMTYVILSILSIFLVIRVQKWKMTDRLWCKLLALSKHVKLYNKLWIILSEAQFSIEPTARPLYFILIQPKRWHFCDTIKLSNSCRWKYEYTQGEKHLASCVSCKSGINTLWLRINEHPY